MSQRKHAFMGLSQVISLHLPFSEVDCQSLYTFNQLVGQATIGLASINLAIRMYVSSNIRTHCSAHTSYRMALWSQNLYIVIPIVLIILGHWSLILQGELASTYRHDRGD